MPECAGRLCHEIGKILAAHAGRFPEAGVFRPQKRPAEAKHPLRFGGRVHQGDVAGNDIKADPRAAGPGNAVADCANARLEVRAQLRVGGAEGAANLHPIADDVLRLAAVDRAEGEHRGFQRRRASGHDGLQRHDQLRGADDGVHGLLGPRRVAGHALHSDAQLVCGAVEAAGAGVDLPDAQVGLHVQAVDGVHALHDARGDHGLRAAHRLLGGLEQQAHAAAQAVLPCVEHLCRRELYAHVHVVPAGVHPTLVRRTEGTALRLRDGQGVHLGPERHRGAGVRAVYAAHDPGTPGFAGYAQRLELFKEKRLGFEFRKTALGNAVQRAPRFNHPGGDPPCFGIEVLYSHRESSFFISDDRPSSIAAMASEVGGQPGTHRLAPLQHLPIPSPSKALPCQPWPMRMSSSLPSPVA